MLSHSFPPELTGVGTVAYRHALGLVKRGHSVEVITAGVAIRQRTHEGIALTELPCGGNQVLGLTGAIAQLRAILLAKQEGGLDLIVVQCAQIWSLDVLLDMGSVLRVPVVVISHGFSCYESVAYSSYWPRVAEFIRVRATLVALSARLEEVEFARRFGLPKPIIIPNGVDTLEWQRPAVDVRTRWGIGDAPWMITVSNHSTVKNHAGYWRLAQAVQSRLPSVISTILGCGYPAAKWGLGRIGVKGGCWYACNLRAVWDSSVSLRSGGSRAEVVAAIRTADLLVVTSHREAAPLVVQEAMAAGTPWLAPRVGAVEDFVGGLVVDNLEAMQRLAVDLLCDPQRRRALGAVGRSFIDSEYCWSKIVGRHEELYKRILAQTAS